MMKADNILDELLRSYRLWSWAAIFSFLMMSLLFLYAIYAGKINFLFLFPVLLFGFLWIGTTSISRHSFVLLKRYIGREGEISILEFLSTQLVVFLFPFAWRKVKKEADIFRKELKGLSKEKAVKDQ